MLVLVADGFVELGAIFPEEDFLELGGIDAERGGEILGIVELLPVAFIAESEDLFGQRCNGVELSLMQL